VPGLHPVGTKQIGPVLLVDQLPDQLADRHGKDQVIEAPPRRALKNRVLSDLATRLRSRRRRYGHRVEGALQTIGENVMVFAALLRHDGLNGRPQGIAIAGRARSNDGEQKVASCHGALHPNAANQYSPIG
jgi:hypothetical protein